MKKIFKYNILLLFLITYSLNMAAIDWQQYVTINGIGYTLNTSNSYGDREAYVSNVSGGYSGDVNIPSTFIYDGKTYYVVSIESYAFANSSALRSVSFSKYIENIGENAFEGCTGLTKISIPERIVNIGNSAFKGCTSLKDVNIEDATSTLTLGSAKFCSGGVFEECPITSLYVGREIKDGTTYHNKYSPFCNKKHLEAVIIGKNVSSIIDYMFYGCSGLENIVIPNNIKTIGNYSFGSCSSLKNINIEDGEEDLVMGNNGNSVGPFSDSPLETVYLGRKISCSEAPFRKMNTLKEISIGDAITIIEDAYFYGCSGLSKLNLSDKTTAIGSTAFEGCKALSSIDIPESLSEVGYSAFSGCSSLSAVYISSLENWCTITFENADANPLTFAHNLYVGSELVNKLKIPNAIINIKQYAFSGGECFSSVSIPQNTKNIKKDAFRRCYNLTSVDITNLKAWCEIRFDTPESNPLYYAHNLSLEGFPLETVIIPTTIETINNYAFYNFSKMLSISLHSSLKSIGTKSFYSCEGISSLIIPESINNWGDNVFENCTGLKTVTLQEELKSIGSYTFKGCTGLTSIYIPKTITNLGDNVFENCNISSLLSMAHDCYTSNTFNGLKSSSVIYAYGSDIESIKKSFDGTIVALDGITNIEILNTYYKGVDFSISREQEDLCINNLKMVKVDDKEVLPNSQGKYEIGDLLSNSTHTITAYTQTTIRFNGKDITTDKVVTKSFTTKSLESSSIAYSSFSSTQTTITIGNINPSYGDKTTIIKEKGIFYGGSSYIMSGPSITIGNLNPGTNYSNNITLFVTYKDGETIRYKYDSNNPFYTKSLNLSIEELELSPTSFKGKGKYEKGDAKITNTYFSMNSVKVGDGDIVYLKGFKPNTDFSITYTVQCENNYIAQTTSYFSTPAVILTTQPAKTVKSGEVIVAAKTNLIDEETKVGFEWRKADAPEDLPSLKGSGAIYQGMLEAKIQNLSTSSFYRVRPYFEDAKGTMYYGEWIAFDPSEFSYCEPTVHTYADAKVSAESVMLTGYVIAGTDNILEQGFEYWKVSGNKGNVAKITATGQRMTAIITNTEYNSSYKYRAYIKTSKGTTYGEEQTFSIGDVNGGSETPQTIQKEISLSLAGYATFYNENTSFLLPNGLSAQVITTSNSGKLAYTTIANGDANGIIPKGVPVILVSNNRRGGTYTLTSTTESASYSGSNLLHGSNTQTMTSNVNGVNTYGYSNYVYYKLSYGKSGSTNANKLGWYWGATNGASFSIAGGKAWLALPKSSAQSMEAMLPLEEDATGIDEIEQNNAIPTEGYLFNMAGQRVGNDYNGIIIVNGKKVIR